MSITLGDAILYLRSNNAALDAGLKSAQKTATSTVKNISKDFTSSMGSVVQGLTGFNLAGLGAAGIATGLAVGVKKAVNELIVYNKSILDAARATGMTVEELSQFVQVGDDVGVSMGSITGALQLATKNGFAPTLASLADLADKANAIASPTERAAMLAKILGRNWAALDPILQLGKARILELAAAQADGLVATEAEVQASEKLRLQLDTLGDSWTALKNNIASKVIPVITDYIDKTNEQARVSGILQRAGELNVASYGEQSYALTRMAMDDMSYVDAIEAELAAHDANNAAMMTALGPVEALRVANLKLGSSADGAGDSTEKLAQTQYLQAAAEAYIAGDMRAYNHFRGLAASAGEAASRIAELITIMKSMTGWSGMPGVGGVAQYGEGAGGAGGGGGGPGSGWVTDKGTGVTYWHNVDTGTYTPKGQHGLDMIFPSGYPNDSGRVAVSSGEHVQVTPAGEKPKSGANVTINVTSSPLDTQYMVKVIKAAVGM